MPRRQHVKRFINKELAISEENVELLLRSLEKLGGNVGVARRMCGMTAEDLDTVLARDGIRQRFEDAIKIGEQWRINSALELIEAAKQSALVTQDVDDMLEVAKVIAPEIAVLPFEQARAKAKAESGSTAAVQVNIALQDLSQRLQGALKADGSSSSAQLDIASPCEA